jgi:hypothetical protein
LDFTPDEQSLISRYAQQDSALHRWGFHLAVLLPIAAFAGYGLLRQDLVAMAVAFFSLSGFMLWYIAASARYARVLASICRKLTAPRHAEDGQDN